MGKLNRGRSNYDLVLDPDGDRPVGLMLDKDRKQVAVSVRYLPTDGHVDPTSLTNALAKGATDAGATPCPTTGSINATVLAHVRRSRCCRRHCSIAP